MKFNAKKIALWLVVVMISSFAIAGIIYVISGGWPGIYKQISITVDESKKFSPREIKEIDIHTVSSDINIIPTDEEDIRVHFYGEVTANLEKELPKLTSYTSKNLLNIEIQYPRIFWGGFWGGYVDHTKLDIYIPGNYMEIIKINTVSGDANIKDLSMKDFNFVSTSGDLEMESILAEKLTVESVSGDIEIKNYSGELNIETVSGNVLADKDKEELKNDIDIETTSGDVKILLPEDAQFSLKVKTISGNIYNEFPIEISSYKALKRIEGLVGNGKQKIVISTISGNIEIYRITK